MEAKVRAREEAAETLKTEMEAKAKSREEAAETLKIELERVKDQKG
jgi:hypothetical protein